MRRVRSGAETERQRQRQRECEQSIMSAEPLPADWLQLSGARKKKTGKKHRNKIQSSLAGGNTQPITRKGVAGRGQSDARWCVISTWSRRDWPDAGCVAVGGRVRGVSGVRVNPVNPAARSNWGKGWEADRHEAGPRHPRGRAGEA